MLFNSYEFIFAFLPITLLLYFGLGRFGWYRAALAALVGASLFFYAWWNPAYLGLIVASMLFNYGVGAVLGGNQAHRLRRLLLIIGISANLALLGWFKYVNFLVDNVNAVTGAGLELAPIALPLAISFFTFQQIAYLVDAWRGEAREYDFLQYCLFVTFFPQLIAGPIVHHKEMLPQFGDRRHYRPHWDNFTIGSTLFLLGLFKKVVLADNFAMYASPVFDAADGGATLTFIEAWGGALAYTFQLYFDFSGYSDMALGLARLFGIRLPLNFDSPYKAVNIIDFWRRWHITLSRFLRDYVYIPLGGNRLGPVRRYQNLLATMLIGGLWHGAGWTFVIWGALHGIYLVVNHAWLHFKRHVWRVGDAGVGGHIAAVSLTFVAVAVSWVMFRATTFDGALAMLAGMSGQNGVVLPIGYQHALGGIANALQTIGFRFENVVAHFQGLTQIIWLVVGFVIVWGLPNPSRWLRDYDPALLDQAPPAAKLNIPAWRPGAVTAIGVGALGAVALLSLNRVSEFLYFQF